MTNEQPKQVNFQADDGNSSFQLIEEHHPTKVSEIQKKLSLFAPNQHISSNNDSGSASVELD